MADEPQGEVAERVPWLPDTPLVFDLGSEKTRFGIAGDTVPRYCEPTVYGEPRHQGVSIGMGSKDCYVGNEALSKRGILRLTSPVEKGIVTHFDEKGRFASCLRHPITQSFTGSRDSSTSIYDLLGENPLLMTEGIHNPRENREKTVELCFEDLCVGAVSLVARPLASLYAQQRRATPSSSSSGVSLSGMSGLVVTVGFATQTHVPVLNGKAQLGNVLSPDAAGQDLSNYMMKIMTERGSVITPSERELMKDIVEKLCYVSLDVEDEMDLAASSSDLDRKYELPDGQVITIGNERFRVPEPLFLPSSLGLSRTGIHESAYSAIMKCDVDDRPALWNNVVLSGGATMLPGFCDRMHKELQRLLPHPQKPRIAPSENDQAFVGASMLAVSSHFPSMCLSRERWEEEGNEAIHSVCPHGDLSVTQGASLKSAEKN
jgi:actin beta/gamma 1